MYETKIGVVIGHKEVYGIEGYTLSALIDALKAYDQHAVNVILSTIMLLVSHEETRHGGFPRHISILSYFLAPDAVKRAESYFNSDKDSANQALVHDQIILALMKLNNEHNQQGGKDLQDEHDRYEFGRIILSMNAIWLDMKTVRPYGRQGGSKGLTETLRASQAIQFLTVGGSDPVMNLLVRGNYFIDEISKDKRIDFAHIFEDATGIELKNYVDLVFTISLGWTVVELGEISENIFKDTSTYFSNTNIPKTQLDKFINQVSFEADNFNALNKDYMTQIGIKNDSLYSHIVFLLKPLCVNQNRVICMNPYFISNLLTEGAYNVVREAVKGTNKEQLLPEVWGDVFEKYIDLILNETFAKLYHKVVLSPRGEKSIDGIIELNDTVLLVETKYPHWSYEARVTGKRDAVKSFILKFARYKPYKDKPGSKIRNKKKGFGQIKQFVEDYHSGKYGDGYKFNGKKIIPVVILGEAFPFDPLNVELMMNHIEDQGCLLRHDKVGYPIVLSAEEVEMIQSLVEAEGVQTFEKIFIQYSDEIDYAYKNKTPYFTRPTSFKNAVYRADLSFLNNSYMTKRFDDVTDRIEELLRPKNCRPPLQNDAGISRA